MIGLPPRLHVKFPRFEFGRGKIDHNNLNNRRAEDTHIKRHDVQGSEDFNDAPEVKLDVLEMMKRDDRSGVCRIELEDKTTIVAKFVISGDLRFVKRLEREIDMYQSRLKHLQGTAIPRFLTYYKGSFIDMEVEVHVACLFLEDCGDAVDTAFPSLPLADRVAILKKLGAIHLTNVDLLDFKENNVVHKDGEYRLIDFQDVDYEHMCKWKGGEFFEGEPEPDEDDFGCYDLHMHAQEMGIWTLSRKFVVIFGRKYHKGVIYPDQATIDKLIHPLRSCEATCRKKMLEWIKCYQYMTVEDEMTPEQYMKENPRPPSGFD